MSASLVPAPARVAATWLGRMRRLGWATILGFVILAVIGALALLAPFLYRNPWHMVGPPMLPPLSPGFPLGTDALGRDTAAGIVFGARMSLLIGFVASFCAVVFGTYIGAIAGYFGGWVDDALMRLTEFFQTIPGFMLAIVFVAILSPSIWSIIAAIAIVSWPPVARLVRAEFLTLRSRDFVKAAIVGGHSTARIIFHQILPNALTPVIAIGALMVASAILLESSLSFLGLGDENHITWGYMIGVGRNMLQQAWWLSAFPGTMIFVTVFALNLVGRGLSDAYNPRLKGRGAP